MKFPPKPKTKYIFVNRQDRRIFSKLNKLSKKDLTKEEQKILKFLYSQLEDDWRTPLEKLIDKLFTK